MSQVTDILLAVYMVLDSGSQKKHKTKTDYSKDLNLNLNPPEKLAVVSF